VEDAIKLGKHLLGSVCKYGGRFKYKRAVQVDKVMPVKEGIEVAKRQIMDLSLILISQSKKSLIT
jgi:hypothetical protein